ncbi:hypothetical protein ACSBR1_003188 [Camellia fascicularis]
MAISDSTSLQSSLSSQQPKKLRWSEIEDDDEVDLCFLLSPPRLIDSNEIKITSTTTHFNKRVVERRSWAKLGDAVNDDVNSRLTMVSTEEIVLERRSASGGKAEESSTSGDSLAQHGKGAVLMVCKTCGKKGDHWTSRCPLSRTFLHKLKNS